MSNILKAMATARESAFFKQEQEADLQRYRTQLISMGKIENAAGANLKPRRHKTFEESIKAFEVLPEVLQQQARLDDPGAAARREIIRAGLDLAGEYEACQANFQRLNCQNTDPPSMDFQRMWAMYQRCILAATNGTWQQASVRVHLLPFLSVLKLLRLLREPIQQV